MDDSYALLPNFLVNLERLERRVDEVPLLSIYLFVGSAGQMLLAAANAPAGKQTSDVVF